MWESVRIPLKLHFLAVDLFNNQVKVETKSLSTYICFLKKLKKNESRTALGPEAVGPSGQALRSGLLFGRGYHSVISISDRMLELEMQRKPR